MKDAFVYPPSWVLKDPSLFVDPQSRKRVLGQRARCRIRTTSGSREDHGVRKYQIRESLGYIQGHISDTRQVTTCAVGEKSCVSKLLIIGSVDQARVSLVEVDRWWLWRKAGEHRSVCV